MNWVKASDRLPEYNKDVLVCFDTGACVVACVVADDDYDVWWTVDRCYEIDSTDMWCEIVLPTAEEYQ